MRFPYKKKMDPSGSGGGSAGGASHGVLDTLRATLRANLLKREGKAGAGCCRYAAVISAAAFCVASATEAQCTTCDVFIKLGDSRSGVWARLYEHAKSDWHG